MITIIAVLLSWLALDDITTDVSKTYVVEHTALAVCACWFAVVAWRQIRDGARVPGAVSFLLIGLAAGGQRAVRLGIEPTQPEYLMTVAALGWFAAVGAYQLATFRRKASPRPPLAPVEALRHQSDSQAG